MTQTVPLVCRTLLIAALLPTGLMTVLTFATGIWFSPAERPVAFLCVLAVASSPFWVLRALSLSAGETSRKRLVVRTATIWTAIAVYVLFVSELLPTFIYDGFRWLVA